MNLKLFVNIIWTDLQQVEPNRVYNHNYNIAVNWLKPFWEQALRPCPSRQRTTGSGYSHSERVIVEYMKHLTAQEDFQFAEIRYNRFRVRKLDNDVSVRRSQIAVTRQVDCGRVWHVSRPLATDGVVPQCRCRDAWWDVGQTDDEVGGSFSCTGDNVTIRYTDIAQNMTTRQANTYYNLQ